MIRRVEIEGFKSFAGDPVGVDLGKLNFLVGPNASGKTSFLAALQFVQNALRRDVEFAVVDLGGASEVLPKTKNIRPQDPGQIRIRITLDDKPTLEPPERKPIVVSDFDYTIVADLKEQDGIPVIVDERLKCTVTVDGKKEHYGLTRTEKQVTIVDPIPSPAATPNGGPQEITVPEQERSRCAVAVGFYSLPAVLFRAFVERWAFFNISPHIARESSRETTDPALGSRAENLAALLHRLEREPGDKSLESLSAALRTVIPGFRTVEPFLTDHDARWTFRVIEDALSAPLPPRSVSDGTIRLLSLMVIAMRGGKENNLIAIEEPENGVHPHLHEHIVDVFRGTSDQVQIIATTHSPGFLDHLKPKEILLFGKEDGLTRILPARDVEDIETFRKRFTLGDLFTQGVLDRVFQ